MLLPYRSRGRRLSHALVLGTALAASTARGDEVVDADAAPRFEELLVTDIAEPKRPGELWIGVKPRLERSRSVSMLDLPLHVETGLARDVGVELVVRGRTRFPDAEHAAAGFGDLQFALKYDFLGTAYPDLALALGLEATFPTGDHAEGFGERRYELGPVGIVSARVGALETHAAFEIGIPIASVGAREDEPDSDAEITADLAARYRLRDGLGIIAELDSVTGFGGEPDRSSAIIGLWIEPVESIEVGVGAEIPLAPLPGREPGVVGAFWRRF